MFDAPRVAAVALATLVAGAGAQAAYAGSASGRPAQFVAAPGERNALTVTPGPGGSAQFSDAGAPLTAGSWCVPFPLRQARCDPDGDPRDLDLGGTSIDLGDLDDRAAIGWRPGNDTHPGAVSVIAGAGDDELENSTNGQIRFDGGDGDDRLIAGSPATGYLLGGAGSDLMTSSGESGVFASYVDHDRSGVRVTLDRRPNDGVSGERDDVRTPGVIGSPGADLISGDAGPNSLAGAQGADVLDGAGGDDIIDATLQATPQDVEGPDRPDTVTCGAGNDAVTADADDRTAVDCERVRVGAGGGRELVLGTSAARAGRAGTVSVTYRALDAVPGNAAAVSSTFRLVDGNGRRASTTARFVIGDDAIVARVRVELNRATRRRLARGRSGALRLIAQRVGRDRSPDATATGYERFNTPLTIRGARTR